MMRTAMMLGMVVGAMVARPVLAHPGHGVIGWLHHGEALWGAVVAGVALLACSGRLVSVRARRRGD
jgi:hypothetical protein